ncbi:MAG: DUF460 domain-containing protein [Candidatus Woesearchaeota archaeon]
MGRLLVAGIDPGTTVGYAFLDLNRDVVKIGSAKELSLEGVVAIASGSGRVVAVGTDKAKCPKFVEGFATKFGARLVVPKVDAGVEEKRLLTRGYATGNGHEADALASALLAYKSIRPLLRKVDNFLKKERKEILADNVKALLITNKGVSITDAVASFDPKPVKPESKQVVVEVDPVVTKLRAKVQQLKNDILLLRKQNAALAEGKDKLENSEAGLRKQLETMLSSERAKKLLKQKEKSRRRMQREILALEKKNNLLQSVIADISSKVVLKKLLNLRYDEFLIKKNLLNIKEGDVLLVEEPEKYSVKTFEVLKENPVVSRKASPKIPLACLDVSKLKIEEIGNFGFVDAKEFEKTKNKSSIYANIILNYKKSRGYDRIT